jgi:hypothetical protein
MNGTIFQADVLERYVSIIMSSFFPEAHCNRKGNWNFRCNVCGDSKKRKSKKRAWILTFPNKWIFYCHNCNESLPVEHWMRLYFNSYHHDYMKEMFSLDFEDKKKLPPPIVKREIPTGSEYNEYKDVRYFKPIFSSNDELFVNARKECLRRMLPLDIWKKWYVAVDGLYKNRLVIPYYDENGKIYNYQCRSLLGQEPKYLSKVNSTDNIYNYYCVDAAKPVVILEGAIDSLFIENAVGCTGLRVEDDRFKKFPQRYFLLDNDIPGREMSIKLLRMGEWIFMWDQFLVSLNMNDPYSNPKKNDINDMIIKLNRTKQFTFAELGRFFTNNILYEQALVAIPRRKRSYLGDDEPHNKKGDNYESYNSKETEQSYSGQRDSFRPFAQTRF